MEGFGRLFQNAREEDYIYGLRLYGRDFPITHHQFFDGVILFGLPTKREVVRLNKLLQIFMSSSGTEINNDKNKLLIFSCPNLVQKILCEAVRYTWGTIPSKYFGVLIVLHFHIMSTWVEILEMVQWRMSKWVTRHLNFPNRLIMAREVLQDILNYQLSLMPNPLSIFHTQRSL